MTGSDPKQSSKAHVAAEVTAHIERSVVLLRGQRVLLDETLAELYGVPVKALNQAVKRNAERFPDDFMFQLTSEEHQSLRSQTVTLETGRGQHRKYLPLAFTEQGVAMLSSVLRSEQAVRVNIEIMRAFVRMRRVMQEHAELAKKLAQLERKYDGQFRLVFDAIRDLMTPPVKPKARRGRVEARKAARRSPSHWHLNSM